MLGLGAGQLIDDLRAKVDKLKKEIDSLGTMESQSPDLITSANLIRANDFLMAANQKKSELIDIYSRYTRILEEMTKTLLDIQVDLKEIIHDQTKIIEEKPRKIAKPKKKTRS